MSSWHRAALLLLLDAGSGTLVADGRVPAAAHGPLGHQGGADRLALGASAALVDRAGGPRRDRRAASRGAAGGAPKLPSYTVTPTSGFLAPGEVASCQHGGHVPRARAWSVRQDAQHQDHRRGVAARCGRHAARGAHSCEAYSTTSKSRSNGRAKRPLPQRRPCTWASTLARSRWSRGRHPNVLARAHQRGQVSGGLQFPVLKSKMMRNILKIEPEVQSRRRRRRRRERRRRRRASHRREQAAHHASRSW